MSPAAKNSRRSAFLAVLLLAGAVIVWRVGRPTPRVATTPESKNTSTSAASVAATPATTAHSNEPTDTPEQRRGPAKREGIDAANIYADAFVLFNQLTDEEKAMIRKPSEEVDAEKAAQLFEKIQAIMALLRAAAKADYCDWGTGEITFETSLPHIGKAMDLGKLALWATAYRFSTDPEAAIDDLSVRARLAHHLAETMIGALVAANFESTANQLLRERIAALDGAAITQALKFVAASTLDADLSRAMVGEMSGVESMGRKLAGVSAEERLKMLLPFNSEGEMTPEKQAIRERLEVWVRDAQRVEVEIAFIRGIEAKMADAMRLPEAEFQTWWKGVENELNGDHPLAKLALPGVAAIQSRVQQSRVERALLTAGADVLQNGPAQVGRYRDPATGGALLYVPTPTGFELRSTYQVKGKPVTMAFSKP